MTATGPNRWSEIAGDDGGEDYAARLEASATQAAAAGEDVHGEANLVARLAPTGGRILDAGCGTGRVAVELDRRGFDVVGVDVDTSMLRVARRHAPQVQWVEADLAALDSTHLDPAGLDPTASRSDASSRASAADDADDADGATPPRSRDGFDVVVAAGNVVPLMAPGTHATAIAAMARLLVPDGLLITGFGLDVAHLPLDDAPVTLADYDQWCTAAGLHLHGRWSTWDRDPFDDGGYAVNMHTRT